MRRQKVGETFKKKKNLYGIRIEEYDEINTFCKGK